MSSSSSSPRRASHESMPSHTAVGPTAPSMLHNPRSLRGIKRSYSGHDSRHVTSPRRLLRSRHRLHYDDEDYLTAATAATTATSSPVPSVGGGAPSTPDTSSVSPLRTWAQEWARSGNVLEDDPLYRLQNNDYYYNSYGKLEIHEEMLGDEVRTGTYRRAILDNAPLFEGKTVLDIGSGTGILSLFAAQAGAKHVYYDCGQQWYGIECSEIVDVARTIATANGLGDRITYIRGEVEDIELPVDEVDIIVSEWMGYCLLYEAMLDSVLYARDKWLAADGYMLPDRAYLYVAGINGWEDLDDRKHFWDSVGGVRMSCVKEELSTEPVVTDVDTDNVCTATACVLELDLYSCTSSDLQFVTQLRLPSTRRDLVTGLVIWFDVAFTFGNDPVAMVYTMTTGPDSTPTHWQQTVIYFDHFCPLAHSEYMSKDTLECTLGIRKSQWNPRNLDIKIVYHAQTTPDPLDGLAATDTTSAVHTKIITNDVSVSTRKGLRCHPTLGEPTSTVPAFPVAALSSLSMTPLAHSRLLYYANRSESLCEEPPDAGPAARPGDLQLMLLRFDRATVRILKAGSVVKARHAMQWSTFPSLLPLFDSIRRALACHRKSSDTLERYRDMLVGIRQADEYIMRARVNDVPVEVLQLIRVWREYCCHRFAWGLTSTEEMGWLQTKLMRLMQRCGHTLTVLDPLAATGWHAYLMDVVGSTVSFQVSDSCPAPVHLQWASCPVLCREALEAVRATPTADVLWLSWPPHEPDDLAFNLLSAFPGRAIVYIGEWPSASTTSVSRGARMFFEAIRSDWVKIAKRKGEVNWPGYNQELVLLERRCTTPLP